MAEVALIGGSFDPPHVSHVFAACYLAALGRFDSVYVIPVAKHAHDKNLTPHYMRYEMCRLSMEWIPKTHVSDIELQLLDSPGHPPVNYSYHTVKALKKLHPDWNIHFTVGADVASQIPNWYLGKELLEISKPFILGRHGYEHENMAVLPNISSTQIRESFKNDPEHKVAKAYLPKPVYNYILLNNLYI